MMTNITESLAGKMQLNVNKLASVADTTVKTANDWLNLLQSMNIIYLLQPYYNNSLKRLTKSPKLYFIDNGFCSYLAKFSTPDNLFLSAQAGAYFENYVVNEIKFGRLFFGIIVLFRCVERAVLIKHRKTYNTTGAYITLEKLGNEVKYRSTIFACFFAYISSAIIVNLPPLLFVIFNNNFGIPLQNIGLLVTLGFITQLITDLVASKFAAKLGYRFCSVLAHVLCAAGLIMLGILPRIMPAYAGLILAFITMSIGGGLLEVLISPIIDGVPAKSKSGAMSLLHSFYCWGAVAVIIITTIVLVMPSSVSFEWLIPIVWAIVPVSGIVMFCLVPFPLREEETVSPYKKLFKNKLFWLFLLLMICSGAAEQAIGQWTSLFAELGLGVPKATGNLLGACAFAVLMGISRVLYGIFGSKLNLKKTLIFCGALTIFAYSLVVFVPIPAINLIGCALSGLGIGIAWPGIISLSSQKVPTGGTAMFALMALGGDIGCASGPGIVGFISGAVTSLSLPSFFGTDILGAIKMGLLFALAFPIILFCALFFLKNSKPKNAPLYNSKANN